MKKSEKEKRDELIEKAKNHVYNSGYDFKAKNTINTIVNLLADFHLQIESERRTFTVKALRKRGTDKWYAITYTALDDGSYPFITRRLPDLWHPDFLKDGIGFVAESNLPTDAELVTLKIEIIEP